MHLYRDGPAGAGTIVGGYGTDVYRGDVNAALGISGNHGFSISTPDILKDGQYHSLYVYAIDTSGGANPQLSNSPRSISGCYIPCSNSCGANGVMINGSCSVDNPPGYGTTCYSDPNVCGTRNSGTILCNGCPATTPPNPPGYGSACTSAQNSCGQTNPGTILCNGCNAVTPSESECPHCSFTPSPSTITLLQATTLTWSCSNAVSCSIDQGVGGVSRSGGSTITSPTQNTTYTLSCSGNKGGHVSYQTTVTVKKPNLKEIAP